MECLKGFCEYSFLGMLNVDAVCRFFLLFVHNSLTIIKLKIRNIFFSKSKLFFFKFWIERILVFSSVLTTSFFPSKNLATSRSITALFSEQVQQPSFRGVKKKYRREMYEKTGFRKTNLIIVIIRLRVSIILIHDCCLLEEILQFQFFLIRFWTS